jgi:hypothetical protein
MRTWLCQSAEIFLSLSMVIGVILNKVRIWRTRWCSLRQRMTHASELPWVCSITPLPMIVPALPRSSIPSVSMKNEALTGRVKATADDALQPITDKPPEAKPRFVWDKQKTVLSFEIFNDLEYSDCRPKGLTRNGWRVPVELKRQMRLQKPERPRCWQRCLAWYVIQNTTHVRNRR